ncbi:TRAP transporter substrate-binding protein [Thalassospira marina]|uniref:C4-dicarboxylate ABC transporter n=1 Tax=Thalassospira marina TaxID=2048283 RepID=A0A2N3KR13_9PROT|nr:TRAP transporter substrate-binding protein [Thalassospira marina]AUG55555.1 C4-dicarboxylate ABC transporter [Thalassospira marina]PKR52950.1 C4-dicarboxylate ABC transporter [Thalassospira marina]
MNKFLKTTTLTIAACAMGATMLAGVAQAREWRGWNIHPPGYPVTIGMEKFAELINKGSDGRLEAKVYNNGVLGDQPDAIQQVRLGGLDWAEFNLGPLGEIVPEANVVSLPFIFKDMDSMHKVMDGPVGEQISAGIRNAGLEPLAYYDSGARSFYNTKKPIEKPEDMKGMKFRVMSNDLYVQMVAALGGNATPMPYGEVFQSLKLGVIDGAENNYPSYESSGHYEAAKYYSVTQHLILPEVLCMNKDLYDSLSDDDKKLVRDAAMQSAELQRATWSKVAEEDKKKVEASGVKVNEITDKAPFQKAMQPIYEKFEQENPDQAELVKAIQAAQK